MGRNHFPFESDHFFYIIVQTIEKERLQFKVKRVTCVQGVFDKRIFFAIVVFAIIVHITIGAAIEVGKNGHIVFTTAVAFCIDDEGRFEVFDVGSQCKGVDFFHFMRLGQFVGHKQTPVFDGVAEDRKFPVVKMEFVAAQFAESRLEHPFGVNVAVLPHHYKIIVGNHSYLL